MRSKKVSSEKSETITTDNESADQESEIDSKDNADNKSDTNETEEEN